MKRKAEPGMCDQYRGGLCLALAKVPGPPVYCPPPRAEGAGLGECCHHPFHRAREQLRELKAGGVNLHRYRDRLRDPAFVAKLHLAWTTLRERRRRSV